ncbi:MAG: calcium/sodium antiporter [Gammaproteobacteria bacterium]
MLLAAIACLFGFGILIWGADRFVIGAAVSARLLGVSTLIIGLVVVGFGTSAPELLVSATASLAGNGGLAVGNALGSNISNIALVLGATALISPLSLRSETLRREYPILLLVTLLTFGLVLDGNLGRFDGVLLVAALIVILIVLAQLAKNSDSVDPLPEELDQEIPSDMTGRQASVQLLIGLASLMIGSKALVWGASTIASALGVSDLVIGLTIVAVGTSLPELAAGIASARKGEDDLVIGNVIGSNLFNTLGVLGIPGLLAPMTVGNDVLQRDFPLVIGATLALFLLARGWRGNASLGRVAGTILLCCFLAYQGHLYWTAAGG